MTSYLRGWLSSGISSDSVPTVTCNSPLPSDDEGSITETERDREDNDDLPPAFPSLNSAQRVLNQVPRPLTDAQLMPPPPSIPPSSSLHRTGPGSLAVPPTTTKRPSKKREKVILAPGHSPMDWANLKISGQDLRGVSTLLRVTPSMLQQHNTRQDAWTAINGKVYNVTSYLAFHPGGEKELMRVVGRDGTKLFALTHAWVSVDMMLDACLVGFLVAER
ncbi:hypothetical protein Ac2012v2_002327 [Leucoagaricus gongylophorus]